MICEAFGQLSAVKNVTTTTTGEICAADQDRGEPVRPVLRPRPQPGDAGRAQGRSTRTGNCLKILLNSKSIPCMNNLNKDFLSHF